MLVLDRAGATCAIPRPTARPDVRSSAGSRSPSACSASSTSPAGNPQPGRAATPATCSPAAAPIGYVVSSLLLDLLRTPYVVVPLLLLLSVFGILVITATPVYQVPVRLAAFRDRLLGRTPVGEDESDLPTQPLRSRRRRARRRSTPTWATRRTTARSSPTASSASASAASAGSAPVPRSATPVTPRRSTRRRPTTTPRPSSSPRRTPRCPQRVEQLELSGDITYSCPPTRCSSRARCTRRAPRPATTSSAG